MNRNDADPYANIKKIIERMHEASEGVWVIAGKGKLKNPPDPCWIILNQTGGVLGDNDRSSIYVFSNEEIANDWINENGQEGVGSSKLINWDSMVNRYSDVFIDAIININSEEDWLQFAPLIKKTYFNAGND